LTTSAPAVADADAARRAVAAVRHWYHTIEVAPGVLTPGWFDLRPVVDRMPWPDVRGLRCLDVATADGFLAFELERRGAAEVVATDIASHADWDWEAPAYSNGLAYLHELSGPEVGAGFEVAKRLRGSSVRRERMRVYEISPERLGQFDVVVCGSLMLHLRDPLRALQAILSVCRARLLLSNQLDLVRTLALPRSPLFRLDGTRGETQWWLPNREGNRQLLRAGGLEILQESRLYCIPYGAAHRPIGRDLRSRLGSLARRVLTGNDGVLHHAVLARPLVAAGAPQSTIAP
jgi:tRNA (mo5U34)-methyltransferase